jgi:hypothetical protein
MGDDIRDNAPGESSPAESDAGVLPESEWEGEEGVEETGVNGGN